MTTWRVRILISLMKTLIIRILTWITPTRTKETTMTIAEETQTKSPEDPDIEESQEMEINGRSWSWLTRKKGMLEAIRMKRKLREPMTRLLCKTTEQRLKLILTMSMMIWRELWESLLSSKSTIRLRYEINSLLKYIFDYY